MKRFAFYLSLAVLSSQAWPVPPETLQRLKALYPTQSEAFILSRLSEAKTPLQNWRAFAPYFYDLVKRATATALKSDRMGLCAGDAHFENFGFLYDSKSAVFTLNDLDDVSHSSLNVDALRLFISHQLVTKVNSEEWLEAYNSGLGGQMRKRPAYIVELEANALTGGMGLPKKIKNLLTDGCSGDYVSVSKVEEQKLKEYLKTEGQDLVLSCARMKESGGSAGLKRYVLLYDKNQQSAALELKPLINPASQWGTTIDPGIRKRMLENAVSIYLSNSFRSDYFSVTFDGTLYQRRPILAGNSGIKMEDVAVKDIKDVALYEANILGQKHRQTNAQALSFSAVEWDKWAQSIRKQWDEEFKNK